MNKYEQVLQEQEYDMEACYDTIMNCQEAHKALGAFVSSSDYKFIDHAVNLAKADWRLHFGGKEASPDWVTLSDSCYRRQIGKLARLQKDRFQ